MRVAVVGGTIRRVVTSFGGGFPTRRPCWRGRCGSRTNPRGSPPSGDTSPPLVWSPHQNQKQAATFPSTSTAKTTKSTCSWRSPSASPSGTTRIPWITSTGTRPTIAWRTCAGRVGASRSSTRTPRIRTAGRVHRGHRSRSRDVCSGPKNGCRTLRVWRRLGSWG